MPDPLRFGLAAAPGRKLFSEITGQRADRLVQICETTAANRLPLLMLGPIVTAYEQAMTEGEGKNTWRTDRYTPCPRRAAGRYLVFLASVGYRLTVIEQSLVDDQPYTGDNPPESLISHDAAAAADEPGTGGDPATGDPGPGTQDTSGGDPGCAAGQAAA